MNNFDDRDSSLKELPTKELKLKRHKDRKGSPTVPPIRLRLKSNAYSFSSETDMDKCFSDRSISSSPDCLNQEHSPFFVPLYESSSYINSLPSSPLTNEMNEQFHLSSFPKCIQNEELDMPLDMSRKRVNEMTPDVKSYPISPQQQVRPTVITCASALLRTQCNISDIAHQVCSSNAIDSDYLKQQSIPQQNLKINSSELKITRPGHRREIVSGSCDPVIDEHFRRSLGKDYQQIFSKSTGNNISITVDDHFAKALGETWHQIQQSKVSTAESYPASHPPNSLQTPQSAHILQHSSRILS